MNIFFLFLNLNFNNIILGVEQDLVSSITEYPAELINEESPEIAPQPQMPADWIEERFRVDRRKLEEMILGNHF